MHYFIAVFLSIACFSFPVHGQATLSGKITDTGSGQPLPGASISIPDLARQTVSDEEGYFRIENLPEGRFTVKVSSLGYKPHTEGVLFNGSTERNFSLEVSLLEIREVVITASASVSQDRTNSVSVESLSSDELRQRPSSNLVDAISGVAGVSQITSGPAVSKPVIRGLSANRVLTVNNGIKQEGQQWGNEHGLEYDPFAADRVEILRGPASLLYGSDALGGVINILDPLPLPEGELRGELTSRYSSNNGLTGSSLMLEGNQGGFVWRARGSYRNAHSYRTPEGYASNTAFNETGLSGMVGFNKNWGYSHLSVSSYNGDLGFLEHAHGHEHEHTHEHGHEHEHEHEGEPGHSRDVGLPMQTVDHMKISLNNNLVLGNNQLRADIGFQKNERSEFEHSPDAADILMDLETWTASLKFYMAAINGFEPIIGLSGSWQNNTSGGAELLIPDYSSTEAGAFVYLRKTLGMVSLNAGARFDYRDLHGKTTGNVAGETGFPAFERDFSNFSGSIGLSWDMGSGFLLKANAGSAFRAPNISELASNGEHHGVERFEKGNTALKSEQSLQLDAGIAYTSRIFGVELSGYTNTIYNYIYLRGQAGDSVLHEGELLPLYNYTQANARLSGLEAVIDLHPLPWLHIGSSFSLVHGKNKDTGGDLPFIPAASWDNEVKLTPRLDWPLLRKTYFTVGLNSTFDQKHVDAAFEVPAAGYHLMSAGIGTTLDFGRIPVDVFVSGNNLFNVAYTSHMSQYRYLGVLNAGRNVQFGLHVPLDLN